MNGRIRALLIGVLALAWAAPAGALPVTYWASVTVSGITDPGSLITPTGLAPGSSISVRYTLEAATPDSNPADPVIGLYSGAVISMELIFQGVSVLLEPGPAGSDPALIINDFDLAGTLVDGQLTDVRVPLVTIAAILMDSVSARIFVATSDATFFADDSIQAPQPLNPPSGFDVGNQFTLSGLSGGQSFQVDGALNVLLMVPEPSTMLLVATGLLMIAAKRRAPMRRSPSQS